MLDLNTVRAEFAEFLASNASKRHSLDAALMHVVEMAYQSGMNDKICNNDETKLPFEVNCE